MGLVRAVLLLLVGAMTLALSWASADLLVLAEYLLDFPVEDTEGSSFLMRSSFGGLGVGLVVAGMVSLYLAATDPTELYQPYVQALHRVAAEHGRPVEIHKKEGVGFLTLLGGRIEVQVQPREPGYLSIWMETQGRQRLLFVPRDAAGAQQEDAEWRYVGGHANWVLRADVPAVARPMLEDHRLVELITELFSSPQPQALRHDGEGIELLSDVPPSERTEEIVRVALRACRHLAMVNA